MQSNKDSSIYKTEFVKHLLLSPILQITFSQFYCHFLPLCEDSY